MQVTWPQAARYLSQISANQNGAPFAAATDADLERLYRLASNQGQGDRCDVILSEIDRRARAS